MLSCFVTDVQWLHKVLFVCFPIDKLDGEVSIKRPLQELVVLTFHQMHTCIDAVLLLLSIPANLQSHLVSMLRQVKWRAVERSVGLLAFGEILDGELAYRIARLHGRKFWGTVWRREHFHVYHAQTQLVLDEVLGV